MNVVRITGLACVVALSLVSEACSSSNSPSKSSSESSKNGEDAGGSTAEAGASTSKPFSTCTVAEEGNGCHDTSCPCTLLTQDQVSSALGVMVGAPDNGTGKGGDPNNCVWTYSAPGSTDKVTVYLTTNIDPGSFEETCGKQSNGVTITAVSGVGDTACYTVVAEGIGTDLNFQKNCWAYSVSIAATGSLTSMFTNDTIEADEKMLAMQVASKY